MLRKLSIVVVAAGLATSAVARADEADGSPDPDWRPPVATWRVGFGTGARWFGDTSAASLSTEKMFMPHFDAVRRLIAVPGPRGGLTLSAVGRFAGGTSEGMLFQTLDTKIHELSFTGGARVELAVWRWALATAQLDLGAARTRVVIGDSAGEMAPVDDSGWHFVGTAWVGTEIVGRVKGRFSISLAIEVGYTVSSGVAIHATPRTRPEPDLSIPTVYAALGDLDTRGFTGQSTIRVGF
jgi:hypothetical protein